MMIYTFMMQTLFGTIGLPHDGPLMGFLETESSYSFPIVFLTAYQDAITTSSPGELLAVSNPHFLSLIFSKAAYISLIQNAIVLMHFEVTSSI